VKREKDNNNNEKETPCRKGMGPQMVLKNEKDEK
jgi:hypothetical protein